MVWALAAWGMYFCLLYLIWPERQNKSNELNGSVHFLVHVLFGTYVVYFFFALFVFLIK